MNGRKYTYISNKCPQSFCMYIRKVCVYDYMSQHFENIILCFYTVCDPLLHYADDTCNTCAVITCNLLHFLVGCYFVFGSARAVPRVGHIWL
jgi:hypothetical protein